MRTRSRIPADAGICSSGPADHSQPAWVHGKGTIRTPLITSSNRSWEWGITLALGVAVLICWEALVRIENIPAYVLPAPSAIWNAFSDNFASLMASMWTTLLITLEAFVLAVAGGVALAVLFSQSRTIETALYPYAVMLQVTPIVA